MPKFYRDAFEQGLLGPAGDRFQAALLSDMFLVSSSPLAEEADTWFLREIRLNRRYMQLEGLQTLSDTLPTRLAAVAR